MMRNLSLILFAFFMIPHFVRADQSNFNRSRVSHHWQSAQTSAGYDEVSGVGKTYRGLMSLQYDYVKNPYKLVDKNGNLLTEVVGDFNRLRLGLGLHLNRTWMLSLSLPFDQVESKPYTAGRQHPDVLTDPLSQSYSGLGDIEINLRRRLEFLSLRWGWVADVIMTLPTGDEDSFNQDGDFSLSLRLAFQRQMGRENNFSLYGYMGGRYAPGSRLEVDPLYTSFEAEKRLEFGLGFSQPLTQSFSWYSEFGGFLSFPFEDGQNPVELSLGGAYEFGNQKVWKVYFGVGLEGLAGEEFSNDERYFLGLKRKIFKLKPAQVENFKKTKYPVYSSSYDILLDSVGSETSVVKKIVGKAQSVYFSSGSHRIDERTKLAVTDVVSHLIKHQDHIKKVSIEGYADSVGDREKNLELAFKRALSVKELLVSYGVPKEILVAKSYGAERSQDEEDLFGRLGNRRAEILVRELKMDHVDFPQIKKVPKTVDVQSFNDASRLGSSSLSETHLFPRPFYLNGHYINCVTILDEDNLTWGEVSKKIYGVSDFKDVLRKINYNRQPSLGDLVYFPAFREEGLKVDRFVIKKFKEI